MPRQPKGRPTIYEGKDRLHHCYLTIGTRPDGTPRRKHIKRKTATEVAEAIEETLNLLKQGSGKVAKVETLQDWLTHWVHTIQLNKRDTGTLSYNGWRDMESICRVHLIPRLGQWRLSGTKRRLEPEYVEAMYARLAASKADDGLGLAPSYVKRMHTYLRGALKLALRRGRADRNVMDLVEPPEFRARKISSLKQHEAAAVLGVALQDPDAARWCLGIIAGPRQGEVLGALWSHVNLDPPGDQTPYVELTEQIQPRKWQHGCSDPVTCVKSRVDAYGKPYNICRANPCGVKYLHGCDGTCSRSHPRYCPARLADGCWRHRDKHGNAKACPPPCPIDCRGHASTCPQRRDGGLVRSVLKTQESESSIALGAVVTELLRQHREAQQRNGTWSADGYVFPGPRGGARHPRRDYAAWRGLLARAGVGHHRLHAARHTTGTFLKATGADLKEIQSILRHTDQAMSARYVDLGLSAKHDALDKVAAALIDGDLSMILGAKRVA